MGQVAFYLAMWLLTGDPFKALFITILAALFL